MRLIFIKALSLKIIKNNPFDILQLFTDCDLITNNVKDLNYF